MVISQGNLSLKIVTYLTYSKKVTIVYVKFCRYNKNTEKVTVVAKKENVMMRLEELKDRLEIKELVDVFANLADMKDAKSQGDLFLPDGTLEFQMGFDGEVKNIVGRESLVTAFAATIEPCVSVYHINGQHTIELNEDMTEANGVAYCVATLVNDVDGKRIVTDNKMRYTDEYSKVDGKWYIKKRRTTFLISEKHELAQ